MGNSEFAIITKIKAMLANKLSNSELNQLANFATIEQIAGFLKRHPHYQVILGDINERSISRGYLEILVRSIYNYDLSKLLRYSQKQLHHFHLYGILKIEMNQILLCIENLSDQLNLEHLKNIPYYLNNYFSYDIGELLHVTNREELLKVIKKSFYYPILAKLYKDNPLADYVQCEIAFEKAYYEKIHFLINQEFSATSKKLLNDYLSEVLDMKLLIRIYRLKKYYELSPEAIKVFLNINPNKIKKDQLIEMIEQPVDQFYTSILQTKYGEYFKGYQNYVYIEQIVENLQLHKAKKLLNQSMDPQLSLFAYMIISEIEINNLIKIIEGVSYHQDNSEIARMLVY